MSHDLPPEYSAEPLGRTPFDDELDVALHPRSATAGHHPIATSPFDTGHYYHLPLEALKTNVLIEARTEAGKSARVIDPLVTTLIAQPGVSVALLLFKESITSLANAAIEAARAGKEFALVTTVPGQHSLAFNPLQALLRRRASGRASSMGVAETLLKATGNDFGNDYGVSYYRACDLLTLAVSTGPALLPPGEQNFRAYARALLEPKLLPAFAEAVKESATVYQQTAFTLAEPNVLNFQAGVDPVRHFDVDRFARSKRGAVVVFVLPADSNGVVNYLVGQAFTQLLIDALAEQPDAPRLRGMVVCDEAEHFKSRLVAKAVQRTRSVGWGWAFAYQHADQLKTLKEDFYPAFESACATKVWMGVENLERMELIGRLSGRVRRVGLGYRIPHAANLDEGDYGPVEFLPPEYHRDTAEPIPAEAMSVTESFEDRLQANEIMWLSSQPGFGFIRSTRDAGLWAQHGRVVPCYYPFAVTAAEYRRRQELPWPEPPGSARVEYADVLAEVLTQRTGPQIRQGENWRKGQDRRRQQMPRE